MKQSLVAAVLAVLAVTTAGCNNADATASKSISDSIMKDQQSSSSSVMKVNRKGADCIGNGLVDKIGTDKLQKYGLLTKDLKMNKDVTSVKMSAKDANSAADTFFGCTDVMGMMKKAMEQGGNVSPKVQACIDKALTKDSVHSMFVAMFSGHQSQATKELSSRLMTCAVGSGPATPTAPAQ